MKNLKRKNDITGGTDQGLMDTYKDLVHMLTIQNYSILLTGALASITVL